MASRPTSSPRRATPHECETDKSLEKGGAGGALEDEQPAPHYMDSLSEQHIDSLPKELRKKAYEKVALLWAARMQGLPRMVTLGSSVNKQ